MQAAKGLLRKLLKKQMRPPRVMITDKLASYGAAKREVMPGIEHRQHKGLNNRAENSHQPTRRRAQSIQDPEIRNLGRNLQCELAIDLNQIAGHTNSADPMPQVDGALST